MFLGLLKTLKPKVKSKKEAPKAEAKKEAPKAEPKKVEAKKEAPKVSKSYINIRTHFCISIS